MKQFILLVGLSLLNPALSSLPLGGACNGNGDCNTGETCINGWCSGGGAPGGSCNGNGDCNTGETCINGWCSGGTIVGGSCNGNGDCQTGEVCINGWCS